MRNDTLRRDLQEAAQTRDGLIGRLIGADAHCERIYRGTEFWAPRGETLSFHRARDWMTPISGGLVGATDLWALRYGLAAVIGTADSNRHEGDRDPLGQPKVVADRLERARRRLLLATAEFVRALPYPGLESAVSVEAHWEHAEVAATHMKCVLEGLPRFTYIERDPLRILHLRMLSLWGDFKRSAKGAPSTTSRFVRACKRAGVEHPATAAAIAALECNNPKAYQFNVASAAWGPDQIADRFDTVRVAWKLARVPRLEPTFFHPPPELQRRAALFVDLDAPDVTPHGLARRADERFIRPWPREVRVHAPLLDDGDVDASGVEDGFGLGPVSTHLPTPAESAQRTRVVADDGSSDDS